MVVVVVVVVVSLRVTLLCGLSFFFSYRVLVLFLQESLFAPSMLRPSHSHSLANTHTALSNHFGPSENFSLFPIYIFRPAALAKFCDSRLLSKLFLYSFRECNYYARLLKFFLYRALYFVCLSNAFKLNAIYILKNKRCSAFVTMFIK